MMQARGRLAGLRARLLEPGTVGMLAGLVDQVVISLANLAVGLLVLRLGTKLEFGLYGLGYTAILMANGFASALFAAQMTVLYHRTPDGERGAFAGALVLAQTLLAALSCLAVLGIASGLGEASLTGSAAQQAVALVILGAPVAMAHDLLRSYRFLRQQALLALGLDVLNAALWIGLTLLGISQGVAPHVAALGGYGLACLATALCALWRSGLVPVGWGPAGIAAMRRAVHRAWDQGRWSIGGVLVTALQNQAHLYLLAWLASVEAAAEVNAARMLMAPMSMLVIGMNRGLLPLLAKQHAENGGAMRRTARAALLFVFAAMAVYLAAILLGWDLLTRIVLRAEYAHIGGLVLLWALAVFFQAIDVNMSAQLQAAGRFRAMTLLNLYTAIPVLLGAVPLILWYGGTGSLLALTAGQLCLALLLARDVHRGATARGA